MAIVTGDVALQYFSLYVPNPPLGDPYINSNSYPADLVINSGTVAINNLSLASYNVYSDVPQHSVINVQGATFTIEGNITNSFTATFPTVVLDFFGFPVTVGGTVTATGGGTIDVSGGGTVNVSGSVQSSINFDFLDAASNLLVLADVTFSQPGGFAGTIEGFAAGDTIDLPNIQYSAANTRVLCQ